MFRALEELIHAYFARTWPIGTCENQNGLNLFFADTDEQLSSFTGLFYSDLKNFIKEMDVGEVE